MTVIAWDGTSLCADKQGDFNGMRVVRTKIEALPDKTLVGTAGSMAVGTAFKAWLRGPRDPKEFPKDMDHCEALVVYPSGVMYLYENNPTPSLIENKFFAIGAGSAYAMGAMHMGATARQAVCAAIGQSTNCGGGVDELYLMTYSKPESNSGVLQGLSRGRPLPTAMWPHQWDFLPGLPQDGV